MDKRDIEQLQSEISRLKEKQQELKTKVLEYQERKDKDPSRLLELVKALQQNQWILNKILFRIKKG